MSKKYEANIKDITDDDDYGTVTEVFSTDTIEDVKKKAIREYSRDCDIPEKNLEVLSIEEVL